MKFITLFLLLTASVWGQTGSSFSTRIDNHLMISGEKCDGSQTTEWEIDGELRVFTCHKGQWLVQVDNINVCNDQGSCTEVAVPWFVAKLRRANIISIPEYKFFTIRPTHKIPSRFKDVLKDYYVREEMGGELEVVPR